MKAAASFLLILVIISFSCTTKRPLIDTGLPPYEPESKELYDSIVQADSLLFGAYNSCKIEQFAVMLSEKIEFYHDRGGLDTSKANLVASIQKNICGKVRRELLAGSIEVYPIPHYGAIEMGTHRFHNLVEKSTSHYSKFVHIWKNENGQWKLSRVISLH